MSKLLLIECVEQEAHAVGLQPEGELQVFRRNVLVVVGAVGRGGAVDAGADFLQRHEVLAVVVLGALEHNVLEEVGEAGAVRLLVLRADVVPDVDGGNRNRAVDVHDQVEAVAQGVLLEGDVGRHQGSVLMSRCCFDYPPSRRPRASARLSRIDTSYRELKGVVDAYSGRVDP